MKIITATAVSILALAEAGDVRRVTSQADVDVDPVVGRTQPIAIGDQPNASKRWSFFSSWNQLVNSKDQPFVPAITLEEFMSVDPRAFEWVDATEIVAGGTTCGFLHAPLGSLPDIDYPIVDVYVCVQFAANQPAPRGNLAVHCGGPGSLSSCLNLMGGYNYIGLDNPENYNVFAFDQRGMGRSTPTFVVPECNPDFIRVGDSIEPNPNAVLNFGVDYTNQNQIQAMANSTKQNAVDCWNYEPFLLETTKEDGSMAKYHFLEYSGTRQLAEDIERVRIIFGGQKLSIYGISYGTKVMGTYATIFPSSVNLMVLDGNDDPGSDLVSNAEDIARSINQRIGFFVASCEFSKSCPVDNVSGCLTDLANLVRENGYSNIMRFLITLLYQRIDRAKEVCDAAADGDVATLVGLLDDILPDEARKRQSDTSTNTPSKPTAADDDYPFPNYSSLQSGLAQNMVTSQDYTFGAYSEDQYVQFLMNLNEKYSAYGTQSPVTAAAQWYNYGYFWPRNTPLPPLGNPSLTGVIAGQMYDPWTPYIWTQKMRNQFKYASLLTSQSVNHGLGSALETANIFSDPECILNYQKYFQTGIVDFVDGTVCAAVDIGESCTIIDALKGDQCFGA